MAYSRPVRTLTAVMLGALVVGTPSDLALATALPTPTVSSAPSASEGQLQEATAEWLGVQPGATLANNSIIQMNVKISANNADGSATPVRTSATVHLTHGAFPKSVETLPGISVNADRTVATLDFGMLPGGTVKQLALDVQLAGEDGDHMTAVVRPNNAPEISLGDPIRIQATHAADLFIVGGGYDPHMAKNSESNAVDVFAGISIPRDGAPINPRAEFDIAVEGSEGDEFELLRHNGEFSYQAIGRMPHGLSGRPTVTVTKDTQRKVFHVVVDGVGIPDGHQPVLAADGKPVDPNTLWLTALKVRFHYDNAKRAPHRVNQPFSFTLVSKNASIKTAAGRPITPTTHTSARMHYHGRVGGGSIHTQYFLDYPGLVETEDAPKKRVSHFTENPSAVPGDQMIVIAHSGVNRGVLGKNAHEFVPTRLYIPIDPGYTKFSGKNVGIMTAGGDIVLHPRNNLPPYIKWSTDPIRRYDDDLRGLRYHSGGAMPDNATVIMLERTEDMYRNPPGGKTDPGLQFENFYVPIKFIGDNVNDTFDGHAMLPIHYEIKSSKNAPGPWAYVRPLPRYHEGRLNSPSTRYPEVVGSMSSMRVVELTPFYTSARIASDRERISAGESATLSFSALSESRRAELTTTREGEHTFESTATIPASLEVDPTSLPQGARASRTADGSTEIFVRHTGEVNRPATFTVRVTAKTNAAVAQLRMSVQDRTPFVNTRMDSSRGATSFILSLSGINQTTLTKAPAAESMSFDGSNAWIIETANGSSVPADHVAVVDIMPRNGDTNGTHHRGTVAYTEPVTVTPGARVYYTNVDPGTIDRDPAHAENAGPGLDSPAARWSTQVPQGGYTAVMVLADNQAAASTLRARIPFTVHGNLPTDTYMNVAWARSGRGGQNTDLRMIRSAKAVSPQESARLQVHKRLAPGQDPLPLGWVEYIVEARNSGATPAEDVVVTDMGGSGLTGGSAQFLAPPEGTSIRDGKWNIGVLKSGETKQIRVRARLEQTVGGTRVENRIHIENPRNPHDPNSSTCTPNVDIDSDTDSCDISSIDMPNPADLRVLKIVKDSGKALKDRRLEYTVQVKNSGELPARDIRVRDVGGENIKPGSGQFSDAPEDTSVDGNVWNIPVLQPGETRQITVSASLADSLDASGTVVNRVTVESPDDPTGPQPDVCQDNRALDEDHDNCDTATTALPAPPDLRVDKTADPGQDLQEVKGYWYTLRVRNAGGMVARDVKVTDHAGTHLDPSTVHYDQIPEGTSVEGGTWTIPQLGAGEELVIRVRVNPTAGDKAGRTLYNRITVTTPDAPRPAGQQECQANDSLETDTDGCDIEAIYIPRHADLKVSKTVSDASGSLEQRNISYLIEVANTGERDAHDVKVTDTGGENIKPNSGVFRDAPEGTSIEGGTWTIPLLKPGEKRQILVDAHLADGPLTGGKAVNRVTVESPDDPTGPPTGECEANASAEEDTDNCDTATTALPAPADLKIDKIADKDTPTTPGSTRTYTLRVRNAGAVTARDVRVTDHGGSLLDPTTITFENLPEGTTAKDGVWHIPEMPGGQELTARVRVKVGAEETSGLHIRNIATVSSPDDPVKGGPKSCQPNSGVDADTDGCDIEDTRVPPKPVSKKLRTGNAGHMGLDPASTAAVVGIGGVLLASVGGLWAVLARRRTGGKNAVN